MAQSLLCVCGHWGIWLRTTDCHPHLVHQLTETVSEKFDNTGSENVKCLET